MNSQTAFHDYSKKTKNVCLAITFALIMIIIFMVSPLRLIGMRAYLIKFLIVGILIFALINNYNAIKDIWGIDDLFKNSKWTGIRNNMILSIIFSLFILFLAFYILGNLFNHS